jgi:hypothetical protein
VASLVTVQVRKGTVARALLVIVLVIDAIHVAAALAGGYRVSEEGVRAFLSVDVEASMATWFSVVLLLTGAVCCFVASLDASSRGSPDAHAWRLLTAVFALLSLDESAQLHELVGDEISDRADLPVLSAAGTVSGIVIGAVVIVVCVPFLRRQPRSISGLLVLAGVLYVAGAAGIDNLVDALEESAGGLGARSEWLLGTIEENLEMIGVILFVWCVLAYLERARGQVVLGLVPGEPADAAAEAAQPRQAR